MGKDRLSSRGPAGEAIPTRMHMLEEILMGKEVVEDCLGGNQKGECEGKPLHRFSLVLTGGVHRRLPGIGTSHPEGPRGLLKTWFGYEVERNLPVSLERELRKGGYGKGSVEEHRGANKW